MTHGTDYPDTSDPDIAEAMMTPSFYLHQRYSRHGTALAAVDILAALGVKAQTQHAPRFLEDQRPFIVREVGDATGQ